MLCLLNSTCAVGPQLVKPHDHTFEELCESLEGIVAKRRIRVYAEHGWLKIKNPHYTQVDGRHDMFQAFHERTSRTR